MDTLLKFTGRLLAHYLNKRSHQHSSIPIYSPDVLKATLRPGDVLLVEGNRRISTAIKYLTQSTWSHAALFIGEKSSYPIPATHYFVEADTEAGVRTVGFEVFEGMNVRICRPFGLDDNGCQQVIAHAMARLGQQYDLRNVWDLARYLIATPPVPSSFRRRMLALGSGDPTRAICSTLIAQAFQAVKYPILPVIEQQSINSPLCPWCVREIMHIRHYSLFAPRDFDISPYFKIIKIDQDDYFDYTTLTWGDD